MTLPAPGNQIVEGSARPRATRSLRRFAVRGLVAVVVLAAGAFSAFTMLTRLVLVDELRVCSHCARLEHREFREYQSHDGEERLFRVVQETRLESPTNLSLALDAQGRCEHAFGPLPSGANAIDITRGNWCSFLLGVDVATKAPPRSPGAPSRDHCMPDFTAALVLLRADVLERERIGGQYTELERGTCAGGLLAYTHRVEDNTETWLYYDADSGAFLAANDVVDRTETEARRRGERNWPIALGFDDHVVIEDLLAPVRGRRGAPGEGTSAPPDGR